MGALGCSGLRSEQEGNNTRMRPTHGRSRLWGCVSMFCFDALQCLCLVSRQSTTRLICGLVLALSVLSVVRFLLSSTALGVFVLYFRNAGAFETNGRASKLVWLEFRYLTRTRDVNRDPTFLRPIN